MGNIHCVQYFSDFGNFHAILSICVLQRSCGCDTHNKIKEEKTSKHKTKMKTGNLKKDLQCGDLFLVKQAGMVNSTCFRRFVKEISCSTTENETKTKFQINS